VGHVPEHRRSPRRPRLRLGSDAGGVFVLAVLLSAVLGAWLVVPYVENGIARDSKLSAAQLRRAAADRLRLDARQFDAFRARLRRRQQYSMNVPEGPTGRYFSAGKIVRDYGAYYFLPAIKTPGGKPIFRYRFR
jgi:hypothetical protein